MTHPAPSDSYWVLKDQLLAGPYPGDRTPEKSEERLLGFLDAGVTCFVDLTEEGEGPPLRPYAAQLRALAGRRRAAATHVRMPIRDVDVPADWQMRAILSTIRLAIDAGEVVYVHCRGGIGRTGTVIGCLLMENGAGGNALGSLQELREHTEGGRSRVSPETEAQRSLVRRWTAENRA